MYTLRTSSYHKLVYDRESVQENLVEAIFAVDLLDQERGCLHAGFSVRLCTLAVPRNAGLTVISEWRQGIRNCTAAERTTWTVSSASSSLGFKRTTTFAVPIKRLGSLIPALH